MTTKEKKEYLKRYRKIDREVNQLIMEKDEIIALGTRITPRYSDLPRGWGESNKVQLSVEKLEAQEEKINKKIDLLHEVKADIEKAIQTVEDDTLKLLLRYRYINGLTWEKIAVTMNYDYRWILRLHGKALNKLTIKSHITSMI